jgi:hypothetical protein
VFPPSDLGELLCVNLGFGRLVWLGMGGSK